MSHLLIGWDTCNFFIQGRRRTGQIPFLFDRKGTSQVPGECSKIPQRFQHSGRVTRIWYFLFLCLRPSRVYLILLASLGATRFHKNLSYLPRRPALQGKHISISGQSASSWEQMLASFQRHPIRVRFSSGPLSLNWEDQKLPIRAPQQLSL